MPRYAQLVLGPAGSGKSSYVSAMIHHGEAIKRQIHAVNLDPAAEQFDYDLIADIRQLVYIEDVMEDDELKFGPNGGLVFAMEYLNENADWLEEKLGDEEDDYVLFDCPGQIELSTHLDIMKTLINNLQSWDFRVCVVFCLDCQFISEVSKFFSGVLVGLSTMINLELPQINLLTKTDLLDRKEKKQLKEFLEPDTMLIDQDTRANTVWNEKYHKLTKAIGSLIDDYALVKFFPINIYDEDSLNDVLLNIDNTIQYGEDQDVKDRDIDMPEAASGNGINKNE